MKKARDVRTRGHRYSERTPVPASARTRGSAELHAEHEREMAFQALGMVKAGLNDREIADRLDVSYTELQRILGQHPDVQTTMQSFIKGPWKNRLERTLGMLATGFHYDEEKLLPNGTKRTITRYVKPDASALQYMLENIDPDHWRSIKAVDLDLHGNLQVEETHVPDDKTLALSVLALIREAQAGDSAKVINGDAVETTRQQVVPADDSKAPRHKYR